jgi:hypothetical protein
MKTKILLLSMLILFSLSFVSADSIGTFKQNTQVELYQVCNNCTYCNITSIQYPNGTLSINVATTRDKTRYTYTLNEQNTSDTGDYKYCFDCGNGVDTAVGCLDFEVSPSGFGRIGVGGGISFLVAVLIMLIIAVTLIVVGFKSTNIAAKIGFITFAVIIFVMAILYSVVSIQQNLYGYDSMISGMESFWYVMKILAGVGFLALMVIIALVMIKYWKIKRGYVDAD